MDALTLYREIKKDKEFGLMHCFKLLQNCEKCRVHQKTLAKADSTNVDDVSNSKGRPIGTKKAKSAVVASAGSKRVVASIDKVFADLTANSSMRRTQMDKRWDALL